MLEFHLYPILLWFYLLIQLFVWPLTVIFIVAMAGGVFEYSDEVNKHRVKIRFLGLLIFVIALFIAACGIYIMSLNLENIIDWYSSGIRC